MRACMYGCVCACTQTIVRVHIHTHTLVRAHTQIGKAEYIMLELMRLGKTDVATIATMAQVCVNLSL